MRLDDIQKIGIIKLGSIGDIIHTLPSAYALRKHFPHARIDWIVEKKSVEILTGNKLIDNIIVIDTKSWRKKPLGKDTLKSIRQFLKYFKKSSYDLVLDFQGLIKSGLVAFLSGAPVRIGFNRKDCRESLNSVFSNTRAPLAGAKTHVVDKNLNLLKLIGVDTSHVEFPVFSRNGDELPIDDFFRKHNLTSEDFIAVIDPSAGWETKCIAQKLLAKVSDYLKDEYDCKVVLMWGPGEYEKAEEIQNISESKPLILCETTLKSLASFLRRCKLMISPDTGPLHLAAALDVQCIGIYGPTCPFKNGPYGKNNLYVSRFVDCAPCYKRDCDDLRCMETITFEDIKEKIDIAMKQQLRGETNAN